MLAVTSRLHDFKVGYVVNKVSNSEMTLREIGSKKTCNISNEMFYKIDKDLLSDVYLLEGQQYKTYQKVSKAIANVDGYIQRFHSIYFEDKKCIVNLRKMFTNDISNTFTFEYHSKTTIKEIEEKMKEVLNK